MTAHAPNTAACVFNAYLCENRDYLRSVTAALAKDAARFDEADKLQRISIMTGGLQDAVLDNLRFWSDLQQRLCTLPIDESCQRNHKINMLANISSSHSIVLLSLIGSVGTLVSINQTLLNSVMARAVEDAHS